MYVILSLCRWQVRVLSDVVLHLLPPHFVRAKQNDSSWDAKKKTAKWRIGWDFQGALGA